MNIVTQNNCRPFDISVSTKLYKVLLKVIKTINEKQYKKENDILILPKILKIKKIKIL